MIKDCQKKQFYERDITSRLVDISCIQDVGRGKQSENIKNMWKGS